MNVAAEKISEHHKGTTAADEVVIVGHSQLLFWWPLWLYGFFMVFWSYIHDGSAAGEEVTIHNILSLIYIMLILLLMTFTNLRLPPTFFMIFALLSAIIILLIKQNTAAQIFPFIFNNMRASMNFEFYLIMTISLFLVWILGIFVYDRGERWVIRSGQINIYHAYRHTDDEMINAINANFGRKLDDFVCHWILGFGIVGDIYLRLDNGRKEHLRNVIFIRPLSRKIEKAFR
jgi:hypothetical protein